MLLVGVPYAANERMTDANPILQKAMRGFIIGIWDYFATGPMFLGVAAILSRGSFHPRFLLSLPFTIGSAVGAAFIPVDDLPLGITSIWLVAFGISYLMGALLLNAPLYATDEHKALDQSFGPATVAVFVLFVGVITAHIMLTQRYSNPLVGVVIPAGSAVTRTLAIYALSHSLHKYYFEPKQAFLVKLSLSAEGEADVVVPPLLGDQEAIFGYTAALFALFIGNAGLVATIVEATLTPDSTAWILSLVVSLVIEVIARTGIQQRFELWVVAKLKAKCELQWPMRIATMSALKRVYVHSFGGTGYVSLTMALSIGCVRAATFGDATMIVWLDVGPAVWKVLLVQLASQIIADAAVAAREKMGMQEFVMSEHFPAGHPLRNTAFRDFDARGYVFVFGPGVFFIYGVFVAFLGPAFVMGVCRHLEPNATEVWVMGTLTCTKLAMNATAQHLVNNTLV
jgi:hypothetical protein